MSTFTFRVLQASDYFANYFTLLEGVDSTSSVTYEEFKAHLVELRKRHLVQQVWVAEDNQTRKVVATGTLLMEMKLIGGLSKVAHIEDVIVNTLYRSDRLAEQMILQLRDTAAEHGCYKTLLNSIEVNTNFYKKLGFVPSGHSLTLYHHNS